jgi:hypothetical protein
MIAVRDSKRFSSLMETLSECQMRDQVAEDFGPRTFDRWRTFTERLTT